jgi:transcriptional regulator with XRE-family HTH domain
MTMLSIDNAGRVEMETEGLARRLRVLRAERNWGLNEAAQRIGIAPRTLTTAERGDRIPYGPTLTKIARGYGVPVGYLTGEIDLTDTGTDLKMDIAHKDLAAEAAAFYTDELVKRGAVNPNRQDEFYQRTLRVLLDSFEDREDEE